MARGQHSFLVGYCLSSPAPWCLLAGSHLHTFGLQELCLRVHFAQQSHPLEGLFAPCHSPGTSEKGSEISGSTPLAPQGLAGSPRSVFRPPGKCRTREPKQSQCRLPLRRSPFPQSFLVLLLRLPITRAPPISDLPRDRPCYGQNVCFLLKSVCRDPSPPWDAV